MMRTWKNHLNTYLMKKQLDEDLFKITSSISWIWKFCSPKNGRWDPKFEEFLDGKIKAYPLELRNSIVESVIQQLDIDEVEAYCFNTEASSLRAMKESCKPFEQTVVQPTEKVEAVLQRSQILTGAITRDGKVHELASNLAAEGPNYVKVTALQDTYKYFKEPAKPIKYSFSEVDNNDVYALSTRTFSGIHFPLVLYACPGSGKTTFNKSNHLFLDTDLLYLWPLMNGSPFVITNMPHMLRHGNVSVAIIPSLRTFSARCRHIPGYSEDWYYGMLEEAENWATCRIFTDDYLSNIPVLRKFFAITP